ncbi:TonB-dependent receptor [Sphingomonas sp. AP4-R1]|uniref:TonB-dependent receptor n=1 Tax=Sphingomonas sp. AP4-R1 TaxID=2735134 RepID=UPI00149342B0|nr:TonB-dependent receptor [Sphingomonas sp. AP4-R1]QJU59933.1 TonB-dependent receptor [Sphingomonas sp. AP4-R1]
MTAQRRTESLQRVPISISAITSTALTKAGATGTLALTTVTPGLQLPQNRNSVTPSIRGVGSQNVTPGDEGATAVYVDGILYAAAGANIFSLNNVDQVEVLRGPQGTLFGRNAVGGLINIITRTPNDEQQIRGSIGYGNYDTTTGQLYVAGGLTTGIAADLALYGSYQGKGWGRNLNLGNEVNFNREGSARSKFAFDLDGATKLILSGDYSYGKNDIGNTRQPLPGTRAVGGGGFVGTIYDTSGDMPIYAKKETWGVSAKLTHSLGWADFTSTTAFRHYDLEYNLDQDGTPTVYVDGRTPELTKTLQQEFLLAGSVGRLKWTTGLFYFYSNAAWVDFTQRSTVTPATNFILNSRMLTNSYAAFAQGSYALTDATHLTVGLRYTRDTRAISAAQYALAGNPRPAGTLLNSTDLLPHDQTHRAFDKLTWRFALDQQITQSILVFGSVSRGFKSGVFNASSPFNPAVSPETLDAYEIGAKADLFDRQLRLNVSAYHYNYDNIQLQAVNATGQSILLNAAKGRINGIDGDITVAPRVSFGDLQVHLTMAYLDATYRSFPAGQVLTPRPAPAGGNILSSGDLSGNDIIFSPHFTSGVSGSYEFPVDGSHDLGLSATWYRNGSFYWDPQNRVKQPAYDLVNGQISLSFADRKFTIRGFVRNLLNKKYYAQVSPSPTGDLGVPGAPRTYGAAFDFSF